jgi:hypothetical protein
MAIGNMAMKMAMLINNMAWHGNETIRNNQPHRNENISEISVMALSENINNGERK